MAETQTEHFERPVNQTTGDLEILTPSLRPIGVNELYRDISSIHEAVWPSQCTEVGDHLVPPHSGVLGCVPWQVGSAAYPSFVVDAVATPDVPPSVLRTLTV